MWNLENGTEELVCRAGIETQSYRTDMWTCGAEDAGAMNWEIGTDMYTPYICKIKSSTEPARKHRELSSVL